MSELVNYLREHQHDIEKTLEALVRAESPSDQKSLSDICGEVLQAEFTRLVRGRVERIPQTACGDQYRFSWGDEEEQVLIIGHYDTVWDKGALPLRIEDGKMWGPGTFDMKGGLAVTLWAIAALKELGYKKQRKVVFLATSDEETGSNASRELIESEARKSVCVLVPESSIPPRGDIKTSRKGIGSYILKIYGIPAHAGHDPRQGVNAVDELALQILDLNKLNDYDAGISVNVGVVRGGTRSNVKAEYAEADVDVRFVSMIQVENLVEQIQNRKPFLTGARVEIEGGINRYPFERTEGVVKLYEEIKEIVARNGYELDEGMSGGGSDGNFTARLGVPTIDGLGPVGDGAHARNEHIVLENLPYRAALIAELIAKHLN